MIVLPILKVIGGLGLLLIGGEVLLRGAVALAQRFGLSHLLIGLTVVAAATSMPELVVTVAAGLRGLPDIGVGNVIGSNIANVLLILGAAAILFPIQTRPSAMLRDSAAVLAATMIFVVLAQLGTFTWLHGLAMFALLVTYVGYSYALERRRQRGDVAQAAAAAAAEGGESGVAADVGDIEVPSSCGVALLLVAGGVIGLAVGSELLVDGAATIARKAGVSDAVIGLTLVAVGTSLPELATSIVAGLRHHSEVALGNVLGSNLFNILGVLAALAITTPFVVAPEMLQVDIWVMVGVTLLLIPIMMAGWRVGRLEGTAFLLLYGVYIAWQF
ncbi:MAG: calcium/sodium antiporter [Kiloniellales bacterium]